MELGQNGILANEHHSGEEAARQAEERLSRLERRIEELLASAEAGVLGKEEVEVVMGELGGMEEEARGKGGKS